MPPIFWSTFQGLESSGSFLNAYACSNLEGCCGWFCRIWRKWLVRTSHFGWRAPDEEADYLVLEMIDQCVRCEPGGELGKLYLELREASKVSNELARFIRERTGEDLTKPIAACRVSGAAQAGRPWWTRVAARHHRLSRLWVGFCLSMLPTPFREQNVSMAGVGERHHWLWDFYQLKKVLRATGFVDVQRRDANTSAVQDFPFYPLDLDEDGRPRKGAESMYVEARKPSGPLGV